VEHHQRGSHLHLRHPARGTLITIPIHAGDLKRGALHAILKQAGLSTSEFRELL
jgi:predicted RNA binding protein YcfA (HicA-like mRNA interferase family)